MNTSSLKSSTAAFTPEDLALLGETSGSDLPAGFVDLIKLMQPTSAELVPGDPKEVRNAIVGDYVIPRLDEQILVKGPVGYDCLIIGAECHWPEYVPGRGGFVTSHVDKPNDARWLKPHESPDGKEGLYRSTNDNRVEETWYVHELILPDDESAPFVATQSFSSTAVGIGKDMLRRAGRKVAGVANSVLTKWRVRSRIEKRNDKRWALPEPIILGRYGEPGGPTPEQMRLAGELRRSLKQGLPIAPEPPEPPAIEAESVVRTPRPVITSGRPIVREVESPPPIECEGPGEFDDIIPF
jgi:hypothetical protein